MNYKQKIRSSNYKEITKLEKGQKRRRLSTLRYNNNDLLAQKNRNIISLHRNICLFDVEKNQSAITFFVLNRS